jgi:hypothetical protein
VRKRIYLLLNLLLVAHLVLVACASPSTTPAPTIAALTEPAEATAAKSGPLFDFDQVEKAGCEAPLFSFGYGLDAEETDIAQVLLSIAR